MKKKRKLLNALMLSLSFLSIGTVPQYVSAGGGNNDVEEFLADPKTHLQFSQIYETDGELKVRIKGDQGDKSEVIDKTLIANEIGWVHFDEAVPPYSSKNYKTKLLLGMQMTNFREHTSETRTLHQGGREVASEDRVPAGQWGNMYKDKTYIRPDTTEHVKKTVAGQYMIDHKEERVLEQIKLCTRTTQEFTQFQWKTRHHIDRADVYKITDTRYESSDGNAAHPVSTSSREEYRNRRYEGQAPNCGDRKEHP